MHLPFPQDLHDFGSRHGRGRGQSESDQAGRRWPRRPAAPAGPARTGGFGAHAEPNPALPARSGGQIRLQAAALAQGGRDWLVRSTQTACWLRLVTAETEGPNDVRG